LTAAAAASGSADTYKCVAAATPIECTRMVAAGTAQVTKYGGERAGMRMAGGVLHFFTFRPTTCSRMNWGLFATRR
jgi:hypothetical protein